MITDKERFYIKGYEAAMSAAVAYVRERAIDERYCEVDPVEFRKAMVEGVDAVRGSFGMTGDTPQKEKDDGTGKV